MGWLTKLLGSGRGEALLQEIDQVIEQALDELGVYCDSVRTWRAERDGETSLLVVIRSETLKTEEVHSLRTSLAFAVNRRLGTRIGKDRLIVMCTEPEAVMARPGSTQRATEEFGSLLQEVTTRA